MLPLMLTIACLLSVTLAIPSQAPLIESTTEYVPSHARARQYAPQIFNALHDSMRQWGSSLNHNGMSFFRATIPKNTNFYHGSQSSDSLKSGMEWLAFEIEHAEVFARDHGPGGPKGPGGPNDPKERPPRKEPPHLEVRKEKGNPKTAALHQYRTNRELHVLFLDGMSAAKTELGTLDQQDYVLCNGTKEGFITPIIPGETAAGPPGDSQRALQMCSDFPVDGVVRMEAGFELILCDFASGVDFISVTLRPQSDTIESKNELKKFEYLRGISYRYQGITAGRVKVDYSSMVSAFWYDVNLTNPDTKHASLPRLVSADSRALKAMKTDVEHMLSTKKELPSVDWQGVVDLVTTRYADRLQFMTLQSTSHTDLISEVNFLLSAFIDYSAEVPNIALARQGCTVHYLSNLLPETESDHLIYSSVSTVTKQICSTLFDVRAIVLAENSTSKINEAKEQVEDLTRYLGWTTWLECGKCRYDEVCFVAIWPYGGTKEHDSPECVKSNEVGNRIGYWGGRGPGRRRPPPM